MLNNSLCVSTNYLKMVKCRITTPSSTPALSLSLYLLPTRSFEHSSGARHSTLLSFTQTHIHMFHMLSSEKSQIFGHFEPSPFCLFSNIRFCSHRRSLMNLWILNNAIRLQIFEACQPGQKYARWIIRLSVCVCVFGCSNWLEISFILKTISV